MQPYQRASQEIQRQGMIPLRAAKTVASTVSSLGAASLGASVLGRALPLLSKYIPQDLAIKGLNKIDPRFGSFISKVMQNGYTFDDAKEFIKDKLESTIHPEEQQESEQAGTQNVESSIPGQETQSSGGEDQNILMKFSPKLAQEVDRYIQSGHPIEEIEQIIRSPGSRLSKNVDYIEKSLGMTFYDILRSIYGGAKRSQGQPAMTNQPMQPTPQQDPNAVQQQAGQGQAALMSILQKLQKSRGV